MIPHLIITAAAADDLADIHSWYENERSGLGDRFIDIVETRLDKLLTFPGAHEVISGEFRRAPLRPYPHWLFYRWRGDEVLLVAVVHESRAPEVWQQRIRDYE